MYLRRHGGKDDQKITLRVALCDFSNVFLCLSRRKHLGRRKLLIDRWRALFPAPIQRCCWGANELRTECNFIYRRLGSDVGIGYFATRPDFTLDVSGLTQRYDLDISVKSNCDTTLLMNTAARNWFYDDDDGVGDDARIRLTNPRSGIIDIWVGTYGPRNCDAVLKVETF